MFSKPGGEKLVTGGLGLEGGPQARAQMTSKRPPGFPFTAQHASDPSYLGVGEFPDISETFLKIY